MTLMLPGDSIDLGSNTKDLLIGPGFRKEENKLIATKCGIFKQKEKISYWIESAQKRVDTISLSFHSKINQQFCFFN
jgi:hypothetical protein